MTTIPDWIDSPLRAALNDLLKAGEAAPSFEWRPEGESAGVLVVEATDEQKRFEQDRLVPAALAVEVAEWLQSQVVPTLTGDATIRPSCPEHDHAMRPKNLYAVAWWSCPESGSPVNLIGENPA